MHMKKMNSSLKTEAVCLCETLIATYKISRCKPDNRHDLIVSRPIKSEVEVTMLNNLEANTEYSGKYLCVSWLLKNVR
jgi:hypothetical protein